MSRIDDTFNENGQYGGNFNMFDSPVWIIFI